MSLHPHNTRTTTAATSELQTLTKLQTLNGGEEEESYEKKKKLNGEEEAQDPAICISSNIVEQKVRSFHP